MSHFVTVERRAVISEGSDGWCGEPCPKCEGTGQVTTEHSHAACGRCGGTGERYEASLDYREDR